MGLFDGKRVRELEAKVEALEKKVETLEQEYVMAQRALDVWIDGEHVIPTLIERVQRLEWALEAIQATDAEMQSEMELSVLQQIQSKAPSNVEVYDQVSALLKRLVKGFEKFDSADIARLMRQLERKDL